GPRARNGAKICEQATLPRMPWKSPRSQKVAASLSQIGGRRKPPPGRSRARKTGAACPLLLQRFEQPVEQSRSRRNRGYLDLLVVGVPAAAIDAEAVEGRRQRGREVAVGAAAGLQVLERIADLRRQLLGVLEQAGDPLVLLVGRPVQ